MANWRLFLRTMPLRRTVDKERSQNLLKTKRAGRQNRSLIMQVVKIKAHTPFGLKTRLFMLTPFALMIKMFLILDHNPDFDRHNCFYQYYYRLFYSYYACFLKCFK
jgi:hypothetical protein